MANRRNLSDVDISYLMEVSDSEEEDQTGAGTEI